MKTHAFPPILRIAHLQFQEPRQWLAGKNHQYPLLHVNSGCVHPILHVKRIQFKDTRSPCKAQLEPSPSPARSSGCADENTPNIPLTHIEKNHPRQHQKGHCGEKPPCMRFLHWPHNTPCCPLHLHSTVPRTLNTHLIVMPLPLLQQQQQ